MGLFGPPNVDRMKAKGDVKGLIKALDYQKDALIREDAAWALGHLRAVGAAEPLLKTFKGDSDNVRVAAAGALGHIRNESAVEPLVAAMEESTEPVRMAIVTALGRIGDAQAAAALLAFLGDMSLRAEAIDALCVVCEAHAGALRSVKEPAVDPLIEALRGSDDRVRLKAATILAALGDLRSVDPLLESLSFEESLKALHSLGSRAFEPLVTAIENHKHAYLAARALQGAKWQPPKSETGARYYIAIGEYRRCEGIGAPAVGPLLEVLGSGKKHERREAADVLADMYRYLGSSERQQILASRTQIASATREHTDTYVSDMYDDPGLGDSGHRHVDKVEQRELW